MLLLPSRAGLGRGSCGFTPSLLSFCCIVCLVFFFFENFSCTFCMIHLCIDFLKTWILGASLAHFQMKYIQKCFSFCFSVGE